LPKKVMATMSALFSIQTLLEETLRT